MISPTHALHLARRFFGSLDPRPPTEPDSEWVRRHLTEPEFAIWAAMGNPDQRHSIEVAQAVDAAVVDCDAGRRGGGWPDAPDGGFESAEARRAVMVTAALLHDSGKNASGLGTIARVFATVLRPLLRESAVAHWDKAGGTRQRLVWYWKHPEIGGRALMEAGSHPLVVTWAEEHHRPSSRWSVAPEMGRILRECDND